MATNPKTTGSPQVTYLGWDTPMAMGVAKTILEVAKAYHTPKHGMPLDLGSHRVLVPSQFAARLIREELAKAEPNGLLTPRMETPETFLNWGDREAGVASKEACLLTWLEVLTSKEDCDMASLDALFPDSAKPFPCFDIQTALPFAEKLMSLRDALAQAKDPIDFGNIAKGRHQGDNPERWLQLHRLEQAYLRRLGNKKLADHNKVRAALATESYLPPDVTHVWLAGLIEPQPLLIRALERHLGRLHIHVVIGCDEEEAVRHGLFNEWGIPKPEAWRERRVPWPRFESSVIVARDPAHALERLEECLGGKAPVRGGCAVAPCERERQPEMIADKLRAMGADAVNPLGQPHDRHPLYHSVRTLNELVHGWQFRLLRKAMLQPNLLARLMPGTDMQSMNRLMDTLSQLKAPQDLDEALGFANSLSKPVLADPKRKTREYRQWEDVDHLRPILSAALDTLRGLRDEKAQRRMARFIELSTQDLENSAEGYLFTQDVADALRDAITAMKPETSELQGVHAAGWIELALQSTADKRFRRNLSTGAIHLPGWMETPWEPSPHLVIFGLTDDQVPSANHADAFLPASLREEIGLAGPAQHFANAAYTLERVRRCREGVKGDDSAGRLDVIVMRQDEEGNGLRPSRLLFLGADEDLVKRARHLFDSPLPTEEAPFWSIPDALKLNPQATAQQAKSTRSSISATAFRNLLENPFEFWLKRFLGMNETSHDEVELDRAGYGVLIHSALERFGKSEHAREGDAGKVAAALSEALDKHFIESFGSDPEPGMALQRETARERLLGFAKLQARLVREGWEIKQCEGQLPEMGIEGLDGKDQVLGTVRVGGRFDRLDFNPRLKKWRVYDYKTFDKIEDNDPRTKHLKELKRSNSVGRPGFEFTPADGIKRCWNELQLPVYYHNLRQGHPDIPKDHAIEVGYIILPDDGEAQEMIWEGYAEAYSKEGLKAIQHALGRLLSCAPETYAPNPTRTQYPTLKHFQKRKPETYMLTKLLGTVAEQTDAK